MSGRPLTTVERAALGFRTAQLTATFWRGYRRGKAGAPRSDNPYADDGRTFSTAYHRAWKRGWEHGQGERQGSAVGP